MELMNKLWAAAKADKRRIVLPEGDEERTIKATGKIVELGLARPVLVGDEDVIRSKAKELDVNLTGVEVIDPNKSDRLEAYINAFYELRKNKGMTIEKADKIVRDPLYFGTMMVKLDDAD
ncbi:MAG: phosphate acyltransferase, partial [Clostridium sp.]